MKLPLFACGCISLALLAGATIAPARAGGTALIQQTNGTVKGYAGLRLGILPDVVTLTSADRVSTVFIPCDSTGDGIRVCSPAGFVLNQDGVRYHIPLQHGTVYINSGDTPHTLTHSTTVLPAHSILLAFQTKRGTYITAHARVDVSQAAR